MTASVPASDHDKIRHWIEERGGHPARASNDASHESVSVDFDASNAISWDEFFRVVDQSRLEFLRPAGVQHRH